MAVRTFDIEPELLVEDDGGGVVHVDVQLDARKVQPIVREVESAASISAVPTPLPCQSSRTAMPMLAT